MKKLGRTHIAEIDGLRAVAVLSVLLFHSGFTRFAGGGFVGVDVFFVISGYLITGILAAEKSPDIHALGNFYFRRILRIAPALFATLILTILVFFLISPPIKTQSLAPSAIAAVFSYSNFWFYQTVDYFSDSSKNPFLHTWSLAVEEQFYFALPLLIFFLSGKREGSRLTVVISLFVASLLAASVVAFVDPTKAFYFPWLRAWELLAGSLLALVPLTKINARAKAVGADIGLLIILTCVVFYKEKMVFPGLSALPPVLGAMGIIAGAGSPAISNWILRTRLMQWIGKISYSLYLVHWPIACAAALVTNLLLMSTKLGILASSFFFAWLSWRYIERPSRRLAGQVTKRMVFTAFAGACACFVPYTLAMKMRARRFGTIRQPR